MDKIKIITRLQSIEMYAYEFINFCKEIVVSIKDELHQDVTVSTWDDSVNAVYHFQNNLSDFNVENLEKIIIANKEEDVFKNENENDKELRKNSKSWAGFSSLLYINKNKESEESEISISITQGAYEANKTACINVEFSDSFLKLISKEFLIKIIKCIEMTGSLNYAVVISNDFRRKVKTNGQNIWVGYLTYFKNQKIHNMLPGIVSIIELKDGFIIDLN
ncbi:Imm52 family immunity protein [Paenibacillus sp. IITD108]|uniref:Imm52 family immunity protein n=2 Tax=unclassified Paenibacillus TaxID=185978 RepID=UPI002F415F29